MKINFGLQKILKEGESRIAGFKLLLCSPNNSELKINKFFEQGLVNGKIIKVRKPGCTTMSKQCMPYAKIKGSFSAN